jgi:HSP20 family molecular chaperone IbpA
MDVYDHPDSQNIIATFELPGVKITDLSISVKQGILVIRGQRPCRYRPYRQHPSLRGLSQVDAADTPTSRGQAECNTRFFPLRELRYGYFYRRFRLPQGIDVSLNLPSSRC